MPQTRPPSLLQELLASLFAIVYPADCPVCGREFVEAPGSAVCRCCWESLRPWTGPACTRCGLPLASRRALDSSIPLCGECRQEKHAFDLARSYGLYAGPLRGVILQLKFHGRERLGERLGELLARVWVEIEEAEPLVVPAPLHPSRKRERGFNQAELLARGVVRKLRGMGGKPGPRVEASCLQRIRATVPQTGLSLAARQENVRDAFAVVRPEKIRGRAVVLIDDVMTTGATLSACAIALKRAGAARVVALTLARAAPQFPDFGDLPGIPVDEFGHDQP